ETLSSVNTQLIGVQQELEDTKSTLAESMSNKTQSEQQLVELTQKNKALMHRLVQANQARRDLHNKIQDMKGAIRVFCRVRPPQKPRPSGVGETFKFPGRETGGERTKLNVYTTVTRVDGRKEEHVAKHDFFDRVFSMTDGQADVYREVDDLVQSALDGYKVCVFAFGQTGSGKTHTMQGPPSMSFEAPSTGDVDMTSSKDRAPRQLDTPPKDAGIIPRAAHSIFTRLTAMEADGWRSSCTAQFLEIYNEKPRDLINAASELRIVSVGQGQGQKAKSSTGTDRDVVVQNWSATPVDSTASVLRLLKRAVNNRQQASTECNERSSRSHSLFRLNITLEREEETLEGESRTVTLNGQLNLIDLAGSERLEKSKATGPRLKETQAINNSLMELSSVIGALKARMKGKKAGRGPFVGFKNSKLTTLLEPALTGSSKTLMLVTLCSDAESVAESVNSLRFARKVAGCEAGKAERNVSQQ
ncbi:kinesin-like protein, partial [Kipferlia bialata]